MDRPEIGVSVHLGPPHEQHPKLADRLRLGCKSQPIFAAQKAAFLTGRLSSSAVLAEWCRPATSKRETAGVAHHCPRGVRRDGQLVRASGAAASEHRRGESGRWAANRLPTNARCLGHVSTRLWWAKYEFSSAHHSLAIVVSPYVSRAEGKGVEPSTACAAPDFESGC